MAGFENVGLSMLSVFQSMTLTNWSFTMFRTMDFLSPAVVIYWFVMIVFGAYFVVSFHQNTLLRGLLGAARRMCTCAGKGSCLTQVLRPEKLCACAYYQQHSDPQDFSLPQHVPLHVPLSLAHRSSLDAHGSPFLQLNLFLAVLKTKFAKAKNLLDQKRRQRKADKAWRGSKKQNVLARATGWVKGEQQVLLRLTADTQGSVLLGRNMGACLYQRVSHFLNMAA